MLTQSFDHFGGAELLRMCYSYSITSSARASRDLRDSRPSALAVCEVDDQRELGRLLNRKVCGLFTAKDTIGVRGCLPVLVGQIDPVRY